MAVPIDPHERIRYLSDRAHVNVKVGVKPHVYYQTAKELLRQAVQYHEEGHLEQAFVLYMKYVILLVDALPKHPNYDISERPSKSSINKVLELSESIKRQLLDRYKKEAEEQRMIQEQYRREMEARQREDELRHIRRVELRMEEERSRQGDELSRFVHGAARHAPPQTQPTAPSLYQVPPAAYLPDDARWQPTAPRVPDRSSKPTPPQWVPDEWRSEADGTRLRTVHVPESLTGRFIALSAANTANNVETCALLYGRLSRNEFVVSHLVVPKQRGTSDACCTLAEEELVEFQETHNLSSLGWIHTHPSQTAFLSSVDLHMHIAYQMLLDEAIAIVYSPKFDEAGTFQLTPLGLDVVGSCEKTGHHPHASGELYQTCKHVKTERLELTVIDLRPR